MSKLLSVLIAATFATVSAGAFAAAHGGAPKDEKAMEKKEEMKKDAKAMEKKAEMKKDEMKPDMKAVKKEEMKK